MSGDGPNVSNRFAAARTVADALLYEGYILYPYRASSKKNQLRWQFGVLTPRAFSEVEGSERWAMRTECLVDPEADPHVFVRVRCLQIQHRSVEDATGTTVDRLVVDGALYVDWDEAVDRVIDLPALRLSDLGDDGHDEEFRLTGGSESESIADRTGAVAGRLVRRRQPILGMVRVRAIPAEPFVRLSVTVENRAGWSGPAVGRDEVMNRSLVAVHTMLALEGGSFLSLLDPPEQARGPVADCRNDGAFPVLIGGDRVMLSSPIVLYDQPEVAPESPGDLYDATEIDEILALRVLTLTDVEKAEARATDPRAAAIIDRCDDMPAEIWDRLHGAVRSIGPATDPFSPQPEGAAVPWWDPAADASVDPWSDSVVVAGVEVGKGTHVVLRPTHRADAQDLFVEGMTATVAGVFKDVDGSAHVAVTVDDDPAALEFDWQGRYLFFHPDEVEPLSSEDVAR